MSNTMVPARRTNMSGVDVANVFLTAYRSLFGTAPSAETLALILAQTSLETGRWQSMWNWNFGNIRGAFRGMWTSFKASEIIDGKEVFLEPGPGNRFRAYPTAHDGADDFLRFLGVDSDGDGKNRYQYAWNALVAGMPAEFVKELRTAGYFTADEGRYRKAVESLFASYLPTAREVLRRPSEAPLPVEPTTPTEPDIDREAVLDQVAMTLDDQAKDFFDESKDKNS